MKTLLVILLLPALLCAQSYQFHEEPDGIPVTIDGWQPQCPWAGGETESCPEFADIDADGDLDCFMGNVMGMITAYLNQGSSLVPDYRLLTRQFAGVLLGGMSAVYSGRTAPVFIDIDADGDLDLLSGDFAGLVHYWMNIGEMSNPQFQLITDSLDYIEVSGYSKPCFWDLDLDGDYDLLVGDYWGKIALYQNNGTPQNHNFTLVNAYWLNIDVGDNSNPTLIDIDADGDFDFFVGNKLGKIYYYRNDGTPQQYNFTYVTNNYFNIDVEDYASPEFADVDGDGDYDLFVGREPNWGLAGPGDVYFYENVGTPQQAQFQLITKNYLSIDENWYGMTELVDIDADGDQDLFTAALDYLRFYRNTGTIQSPSFTRESSAFQGIMVNDLSPFFCDIDADGDQDLFCGSGAIPGPPGLYLFLNQGTPRNPNLVLYSNNFVPGNFAVNIVPSLVDIDADGDLDLFISEQLYGHYYFHRNQGSPQWPNFVLQSSNWQGINSGQLARCSIFLDVDSDSDQDLFFNNNYNVSFYRNLGTPQIASMVLETNTAINGLNYTVTTTVWGFDFVDINGDSLPDFFGGNGNGGILYFRNCTNDPLDPRARRPAPIHPTINLILDPGVSVTTITIILPSPQPATLAVYNLLGAKVATLTSGFQPAGQQRYFWETTPSASGVYLVRLEAGQQAVVRKVVLLK